MANCGKCLEYTLGPKSRAQILKAEYWLLTDRKNTPPGGWTFGTISSRTPSGVIDLMLARKIAKDAEQAYQMFNAELGARKGINLWSQPEKEIPESFGPGMDVVGPILWNALALSVVSESAFESQLTQMGQVLNSKIYGCKECLESLAEHLLFQTDKVNSIFHRAKLVHKIHNQVNAKLNKPHMSWEDACEKWGWPVTEESEI